MPTPEEKIQEQKTYRLFWTCLTTILLSIIIAVFAYNNNSAKRELELAKVMQSENMVKVKGRRCYQYSTYETWIPANDYSDYLESTHVEERKEN